jgi:hypothetical protein
MLPVELNSPVTAAPVPDTNNMLALPATDIRIALFGVTTTLLLPLTRELGVPPPLMLLNRPPSPRKYGAETLPDASTSEFPE